MTLPSLVHPRPLGLTLPGRTARRLRHHPATCAVVTGPDRPADLQPDPHRPPLWWVQLPRGLQLVRRTSHSREALQHALTRYAPVAAQQGAAGLLVPLGRFSQLPQPFTLPSPPPELPTLIGVTVSQVVQYPALLQQLARTFWLLVETDPVGPTAERLFQERLLFLPDVVSRIALLRLTQWQQVLVEGQPSLQATSFEGAAHWYDPGFFRSLLALCPTAPVLLERPNPVQWVQDAAQVRAWDSALFAEGVRTEHLHSGRAFRIGDVRED